MLLLLLSFFKTISQEKKKKEKKKKKKKKWIFKASKSQTHQKFKIMLFVKAKHNLYPENLRVVFCPNKECSVERFMCLALVLER